MAKSLAPTTRRRCVAMSIFTRTRLISPPFRSATWSFAFQETETDTEEEESAANAV